MLLRTRIDGGGTPLASPWGVDSEYGRLRDVLVGPIDHYGWRAGNAVAQRSERLGRKFDPQIAATQHRELVQAFEDAGVKVHALTPDPDLPYQVFARDSSVMTPWGAIIMQMQKPFRRGEYAECIRFYLRNGIPIFDMVTAGNVEGGDFMVIKPGLAACGYTGERSIRPAIDQLKRWFEAEGWDFLAYEFDPHFLHLDVQFAMLGEDLAVGCKDALEAEFVQWLSGRGIRLIDVSYRDAMQLGCNVVALGDGRVLVPASAKALAAACRAEGLTVYSPQVDMISAGGGAVHCMCQPLRRDSVA